jgi:hypothetical protein
MPIAGGNTMPFNEEELTVISRIPVYNGDSLPVFSFPASMREGVLALMDRKPIWEISNLETRLFSPSVNPDSMARAFVIENGGPSFGTGGGPDMFGIEWEYQPAARGSMVRPGTPLLSDANEWADKVVWPDIDAWDWAGSAERNKTFADGSRAVLMSFQNGWFERLVSMMDFSGAALALIDEDQKDAVSAFFDKLTALYIRLLGKSMDHFPFIDGFWIHDDWGGQNDTFFSAAVCAEMIVPYMRRLTDYVHSRGRFCDFHSCGQNFKQVPNMIAAGWDSWSPQRINDLEKIHELYGDRLILGIDYAWPGAGTTEEEQRAAAIRFAGIFCDPARPTHLISNPSQPPSEITRAELYRLSRQRYSEPYRFKISV